MAGERRIVVRFLGEAKDLVDAAGDSESALNRVAGTAGSVAKGLAVGLFGATTAAAGGLYMLGQAGATEEQSQASFAQSLRNSVGATEEQIAATERSISIMQSQTGLIDDDLRSAYTLLNGTTRDTAKTQEYMGIAMNIAAAQHISAAEAADIMAAAGRGEMDAIENLGVATENAAGEALSFDEIMRNASEMFAGQAATAAGTTAGQYQILKTRLGEAAESLGQTLLPAVVAVGSWLSGNLVPAVEDAASWLGTHLGPIATDVAAWMEDDLVPAIESVATWIGDTLVPAIEDAVGWVRDDLAPALDTAATTLSENFGPPLQTVAGWLQALAPHIETVVGWLGDLTTWILGNEEILTGLAVGVGVVLVGAFVAWAISAGSAAVATIAATWPILAIIAAVALLVAGLIYAYENWGWFRDAVNAVKDHLVNDVWPALQMGWGILSALAVWIWDAALVVTDFAVAVGAAVAGLVSWIWQKTEWLRGVWTTGWRIIWSVVSGIWSAISSTITNAMSRVTTFVSDHKDQIVGAFRTLVSSVRNIMSGIAGAITGPFRAGLGAIKGIWNNTIGGLGVSLPSWLGGKSFKIPFLAAGGVVTQPTLAMLAEGSEPEAVIPLSQLGRYGSGGGGELVIRSDGSRLADLLIEVLREGIKNRGGLTATFGPL